MTDIVDETRPGSVRTIGNRYQVRLNREIGSGGMAVVYEGVNLRDGGRVAIKTLKPQFQRDPVARTRFLQEGRLMGSVSHPNVVKRLGLFEEKTGVWLVMEHVDGVNLHDLVEDEGPLDVETVYSILEDVGDGLEAVHRAGIVHLDIKPHNLIWQDDGRVKIIDFGLAQASNILQERLGEQVFGTVAYLAPEQAMAGIVTAATDVYALGCVIYELLTGRPPFVVESNDAAALVDLHMHADAVHVSTVRPELGVPRWIDEVLRPALAKDRVSRYQTMDDFVASYAAGLDGRHIPRARDTEQMPRVASRNPLHTFAFGPRRESLPAQLLSSVSQPETPRRSWRQRRREPELRRSFWRRRWHRIVPAVIGLLLIFLVVFMVSDGPSMMTSRLMAVSPGTWTTVSVPNLNVRAQAGADEPLLASIPAGTKVKITGVAEIREDGRWWPIRTTVDNVTVRGWVWGEGLNDNWWMRNIARFQTGTSWFYDARDAVTGMLSTGQRFDRLAVTVSQHFHHGLGGPDSYARHMCHSS